MSKNRLTDLNDHLFETLERLNDDELMHDDKVYSKEIQRAKAISGIGMTIVNNARVILEAKQHQDEYYGTNERGTAQMPGLFQLDNKQ